MYPLEIIDSIIISSIVNLKLVIDDTPFYKIGGTKITIGFKFVFSSTPVIWHKYNTWWMPFTVERFGVSEWYTDQWEYMFH